MAFCGLRQFVRELEVQEEVAKIEGFIDPEYEVAEIADRFFKSAREALLIENNGTGFPVLINAFGSYKRLTLALGEDPDNIALDLDKLFSAIMGGVKGIRFLPRLIKSFPKRSILKGRCQQIVHYDPDLSILPVLKCWPHDGGSFITLPIVHTNHPITGKTNAGMYRMQVLNRNTTAMHWQRHKTGANHFEAWKKKGEKMPVSVVLGGDPVYTYASTAPLPENIDEYVFAGFLRKKRVKMVRCKTNDLYVPEDADIVIEGYVDPLEDMVWEGPFGDHTGFYSLADWYPRFHVTCITQSRDAIYPATVVGVPPMEDTFFAKATEKIFLSPIKKMLQPEIIDLHMPDVGVAHNMAIVKISKNYPGQGKKVISSLFGAGQMSFTKFLVIVDGEIDIRNYGMLIDRVLRNVVFGDDLIFLSGPLDVLDHSADSSAFGGKVGIDATVKIEGEIRDDSEKRCNNVREKECIEKLAEKGIRINTLPGRPVLIISVPVLSQDHFFGKINHILEKLCTDSFNKLVIIIDDTVDVEDYGLFSWYFLANCDPKRDGYLIGNNILVLDGTIKVKWEKFNREWPNIVASSPETIEMIDQKWSGLGLGPFICSPSQKYRSLVLSGKESIKT